MIRLKSQRDLPLLDRVVELGGVVQGNAVVVMRVGEVRLERDRLLQQWKSFGISTGVVQQQAEIAERFCVVWLLLDGGLVGVGGFVESAQRSQRLAKIVVSVATKAQLDGFGDVLDGDIGSSDLMRQNAVQMQSRRMVGILGQNLNIELFGLLKLAGLVVRQGRPKKVIRVWLLHVGVQATGSGQRDQSLRKFLCIQPG